MDLVAELKHGPRKLCDPKEVMIIIERFQLKNFGSVDDPLFDANELIIKLALNVIYGGK